MLVAQFQEKLTADTQRTEELFGNKVEQVTGLLGELAQICGRVETKATTLREKSKLTVSSMDLYKRNFASMVPASKLKIENMWNESVREGGAELVDFLLNDRRLQILTDRRIWSGWTEILPIPRSATQGERSRKMSDCALWE